MAEAIPQPPNTLGNITDLVSKLAPLFLGTGKTTTTSTSTSSPGALAANQQLYTNAIANANNPSATDATVANILNKSAVDFAPVIGEQNAAGLYNSSTLSMLSAQAQGQAVAQSAQAVLQYQTQQEQIAAQANSAALSATKTTTGTTQTAPTVDPTLSILGAAGSLGLNAFKTFFPDQTKAIGNAATGALKSGFNSIKNLFGSGASDGADAVSNDAGIGIGTDASGGIGQVADAGDAINSITSPTSFSSALSGNVQLADAGVSDVGNSLFDSSSIIGDDAAIDASGLIDSGAAASADTIASFGGEAADFGADGVTDVGADVASGIGGEVAADSASAALGLAGGISAVGGAIHLAGSLIGGDAGTGVEAVGDLLSPANGIADVGGAIGDAVGGDVGQAIDVITDPIGAVSDAVSVACTALRSNGQISKNLYVASSRHFQGYHELAMEAYYKFANPLAKYIKANPNSYKTFLLQKLFSARARYILGEKNIRNFLATKLVSTCCVISYICIHKKFPSYEILLGAH